MWCYQKPGFQALLLAELQRQQQGSQFCDTLLKTDGVSVPAHSCILSALSPQMSSALSSTPPPPAGQKRLLEFRAVGACTLLHMVRLLYSGEMAGEGEKEKEEAISAAAKLGIHGLVEVTEQDRKSRGEKGEGRHVEVGVQTEPLAPEENDGQQARWRREVREGNTFLWKETLSDAEKETQTQKVQVHTAPPPQPAVSYDTIDMNALQSLGQADHQLLPPQIPYIPLSFIYPPDENHTQQHTLQEPTAALALPYASTTSSLPPFPSQATMCAAEWEDQQLEQFHGNIPGYISYFLNPDHEEEEKEEGSRGGRGRRRQRGARRAGTGERRARRPRARAAGRGRGGYMQTVDVQSVGVSTLQKMFLHRSGMRSSRPGQGGGAAGRKLFMKTRELLQTAKKSRRRGKVWEFNEDGEVIEGGAGKAQPRRRNTVQQVKQDSYPTGRAQRTRATPNTSFSSPPMRFLNSHPLSACSPTLHHSPLPCLLSPLPSYVSPLRRPALTPHPPEHIDLLLEQVMMGLDILPNNTTCAAPSQPPLPASSSSCTYAPNKQQGSATGLLEAGAGSTQVVDVAGQAGGFSSQGEEPIVQQQEEGELNEMLEQFLQSFERQVDSGTARGAMETAHQSCTLASQPNTVQSKRRKAKTRPATPPLESLCTPPAVAHHSPISESETVQRRSRPCTPSVSPKPTEETPGEVTAPARQRDRKRENRRRSSVNKKGVRVRARARVRASKPESSSDTKNKMVDDRGDKQLQQMPVVKLEMRGQLPVTVTLQGQSCRSLEVKSPTQTKRTSSSEKYQHDIRKSYPIRSRIREGDIMATVSYRHEFPLVKQLLPVRRRGRPRKNGQLPSSSNGKSSTALVQPCGPDDQLERTQEKHEEQEQPQEDGATKRRLESEGETSDDASTAKRVRFETHEPSSASEDAIDVEGVLTTSVGQCFHREEREEIPAWQEIQLREFRKGLLGESMESSCDEIIDVGEEGEWDQRPSRTPATLSLFVSPPSHMVSLGSTGSCEEDKEEDIDVTGGSSPGPDPVIIDWTGSSEEEDEDGEEDVDVVGEKADCAPSAIFISMSQDEFVNRTYQTEMLLR